MGLSTVATLAAARSHWEIFVQSEMDPCEFAKHVTPKQRGWSALMNIITMLEELRAERQMIEESILVLERLAIGRGKRRGRPPKWMSAVSTKRRGRPPGSKNKTQGESASA
jgi:hypothetical protein